MLFFITTILFRILKTRILHVKNKTNYKTLKKDKKYL